MTYFFIVVQARDKKTKTENNAKTAQLIMIFRRYVMG